MSTARQNQDWSRMITAARRGVLVLGAFTLVLAAVYQVHVRSRGPDQRATFRLGGSPARIRKILERDKARQAEESETERDLDAERRWGLGGKDEHRLELAIEKPVNAKVIMLKGRPVADEVNWREYEKNITEWTWTPSRENIALFRKELRVANIDVRGHFVTSNATRQAGSRITTYLTRDNVTLPSTFARYQPEVSPFDGKRFQKCSVVGNSGLLVNSACGRHIDTADYVFRINVPEMDPYIEDVGYKTDFTTLNPSIFKRKYNYFASTRLTEKFNQDMAQFRGLLMFPCFSDAAWVPVCTRALRRLTPKKALGVVFGDPDQFSLIRDYWVTQGLKKYPSTGLYLATAAVALCKEVHVYGFWPFVDSSMPHVTTHPVRYHYFDGAHMVRTHDMQVEFALLSRLHRAGVLRLHLRACPLEGAGLDQGDRRHGGGGTTAEAEGSTGRQAADRGQQRIADIEKLWQNA